MYNQNENVPFNWANVHHSQNHDSHSQQEETPLPPPPLHQSEFPERYVTSEQGIYDNAYDRYEARPAQNLMPQPPSDIQDLNPRPIVNYPTSSAHIPNWELYSAHSATQYRTASFQPIEHSQTHSSYQSHETPHVPQFPPAQLNTWGYWSNPNCDNNNNSNIINSQCSQQSRRHSTPPFYPNQDSGEVTAGKIKPPYVIKACASCKASHVACDAGRPCQRCIRLGKTETCVDAKRKKRGRPKNSTKSQQQQSVPSTTDSAGNSSAEATPITTASTRDPPDQLLELSQLLADEPSSDEQTATDYSAAPINRLERFPSPVSSERRATPLSPSSNMRASAVDGQSSIRKQKSLPSSLAARTGSSTSPGSTPKRRHSHRSAQEAPTTTNIQPIMLQHYQSVQYPAAQLRHGTQPIQFQDPSAMALTAADMQGITQIRTPVPHHYLLASSTPSRAIHPLSAQFTYDDSDTDTEYRSMHNHHNR